RTREEPAGRRRTRPGEMSPPVVAGRLDQPLTGGGAHDARYRYAALRQPRQHLLLRLEERTLLARFRDLEDDRAVLGVFDEKILIALTRDLARRTTASITLPRHPLHVSDAKGRRGMQHGHLGGWWLVAGDRC